VKLTPNRIRQKIIRTFFDEQWSVLVCDRDGNILTHIAPPKDRFWADPFPVEYNDKTYIFVEQQIGHDNGTLGLIELYPDLTYSHFHPILEKSYHLSYPHVFNVNGIWYLVPESHENKTLDIYKAVNFPFQWAYLTTPIENIDANDSTILFYRNKWWIFTSAGTKTSPANKNLCIFYSDSFPSNSWTAHPSNPVCSTLTNSRMAGAFFLKNELLYRPAQNCLKDYGKEININQVLELSPALYREKTIQTIHPERHLKAVCTHTFNSTKKYIVRDIKTRRFKLFR
jgi:hypothetical protein